MTEYATGETPVLRDNATRETPVLREKTAWLETLSQEEFHRRFGSPDTSGALCGFTNAVDTRTVLTLLAHARARRILEIGTAEGHMTANFTQYSDEDAVVFTMGTVADLPASTTAPQRYETPDRQRFGRLANAFGKAAKVFFITADSLSYDFRRLDGIDFAFIDGAHDFRHVLSDSLSVYDVLRPGGWIVWHDFTSSVNWVEVRRALERLRFDEPVVHVAGTAVAFLRKQDGSGVAKDTAKEIVPAFAKNAGSQAVVPPRSGERGYDAAVPTANGTALSIVWEGTQQAVHSLAIVNRQLCTALLARGHTVSVLASGYAGLAEQAPNGANPPPGYQIVEGDPVPLPVALAESFYCPLPRAPEIHVRHQWPPQLTPPAEGRWVVMQPWEYGSIPKAWVEPLLRDVDDIWAPSGYVRDCFLAAGLPADRVHVVPLGVDCERFSPRVPPVTLPTAKCWKFLFVGGTIHRKGIDVLLDAWARAFSDRDDVCLVIKDMGTRSFYRGQTAERSIAEMQQRAGTAQIVYLDQSMTESELAGLYTACDCLVHPYRGEGFGLPIAEALASGLPVIVTGMGAALDFCDDDNAYLIPARRVVLPEKRVGDLETVDYPWLAEPDVHALAALLRHVHDHRDEAKAKGRRGRDRILAGFTWDHAAALIEQRSQSLRLSPVRRVDTPPAAMVHGHRMLLHKAAHDRFISAPLLAGAPYEPFETQLVRDQIRPGDIVLDLGAHVGYYTLLMARQVGPRGKVFAFEPDSANFELLRRNVEESGYGNVTLVRKAASDRNGMAQLYRSADNQGDHRLYPCAEQRPSVNVDTVRLDDFFADSSIRLCLIKMDIQGCEAMALDGMRQLLARSPEVKLFCEFWPFGLRRAGSSAEAMLQLLVEQGFLLHEISATRRVVSRVLPAELMRCYPDAEESFTNLFCARMMVAEPVLVRAPKVTLCMIVKNEEANLSACLEPVRDLVDEIIVVDTGSTDHTRDIAAGLGARVFDFPWVDSFAAARNACLEHATGAWIFWLDADDRLDATNRERLRTLFDNLEDRNDAWVMKCHCLAGPEGGSGTVVDHVQALP